MSYYRGFYIASSEERAGHMDGVDAFWHEVDCEIAAMCGTPGNEIEAPYSEWKMRSPSASADEIAQLAVLYAKRPS